MFINFSCNCIMLLWLFDKLTFFKCKVINWFIQICEEQQWKLSNHAFKKFILFVSSYSMIAIEKGTEENAEGVLMSCFYCFVTTYEVMNGWSRKKVNEGDEQEADCVKVGQRLIKRR